MSLAVKYRPQTFEEVCGQSVVVKILQKAIEKDKFSNVALFAGPSGCGKTTLARLFANKINRGLGNPIEIDAASNNGVDNVRSIVDSLNTRAIVGEYKTIIIDECVSGDTEVLTETGWKRFDTLDKTEKIAQYTDSGKIEFVKPLEFIEKDYKGQMYKIKIGNKAEFIMSPNHVQPLYYKKSEKIKESYIKDIKFAQSNYFIRSGEGVGKLDHLSTLDKIAIVLHADGCLQHSSDHNYWTIQLKNQTKIEHLVKLLAASELDYSELKSNRPGVRIFKIKTPLNITKKLDTYFKLDGISYNYAKEFIEELMLWDDHKQNKYCYYSSIDKVNVDFCQCVGILGGFKSRIYSQQDNRKTTYKTNYRLYLENSKISTSNSHTTKESFDFDGKIYCVKVPSHKILIRRDSFELVTGNCHMITKEGWNAFLKGIEECPKYTVLIFCTTEPNKIPATILNRVQRYNLSKISMPEIKDRLEYICQQEGFINYNATCDLISKTCQGGMRDAISMLEQCADFSTDLSLENTKQVLGESSFETMFKLTWALQQKKSDQIITIIDTLYNTGRDLKQFISLYLDFVLDLEKYILFKDVSLTSIPAYLATKENPVLQFTVKEDNSSEYFRKLTEVILNIKQIIKYDTSYKSTIEILLLKFSCGD